MGSVVRMGPCGGGGGGARDMDTRGVDRVAKVVVRHGDTVVDAVSVLYDRGGRHEWTDLWGGPGGALAEICLGPDEHLTSVEGRCGELEGSFVVRSLTFVSNRRAYGPYGGRPNDDVGGVRAPGGRREDRRLPRALRPPPQRHRHLRQGRTLTQPHRSRDV